jgi:hypothetical protein
MVEVHYIDEPPVTYLRPEDRVMLESLKHALGLTGREVYPMLQRILVEGLDPIDADGAEFELGGFLEVPRPNAKVDVIEARKATERDIKTCQMLLEGEVDRAELVLRNSIEWCRFWAERAPTAELREAFEKSLRRLETGRGDDDG